MRPPCSLPIKKELDIVAARQKGRDLAKEIGFGTVNQARIATAISELARNLYLYAEAGKIIFEVINRQGRKGLRIVAIDKGPGIKEISHVMQDGYTTSGGLGAGLPGVKRLMDEFEIESEEAVGTKIATIKWYV